MAASDFTERLRAVQRKKSSLVCVGLDPDPDRMPRHLVDTLDPADAVAAFNRAVIEATASVAAAYKLNLAFYEALGADGWRVMEATLDAVPEDALTIADGKRGDIGNSARYYARAAFDQLGFDACTVTGYMGRDSVLPFLEYSGRGAFMLARTSNPGASDFQELSCRRQRLYERVVRAASTWAEGLPGVLGFVAGATDPIAIRRIRELAPGAPLLIPGVGAQGGDARTVLDATADGDGPVLINSSRSIIYASDGEDFAEAAGERAESLRDILRDAPDSIV